MSTYTIGEIRKGLETGDVKHLDVLFEMAVDLLAYYDALEVKLASRIRTTDALAFDALEIQHVVGELRDKVLQLEARRLPMADQAKPEHATSQVLNSKPSLQDIVLIGNRAIKKGDES